MVHRDLKPANVLVTLKDGNPVPKVIDFGIAKALAAPQGSQDARDIHAAVTLYPQFLGTPQYMSPEQAGAGAEGDNAVAVDFRSQRDLRLFSRSNQQISELSDSQRGRDLGGSNGDGKGSVERQGVGRERAGLRLELDARILASKRSGTELQTARLIAPGEVSESTTAPVSASRKCTVVPNAPAISLPFG